MDRSEAHLHSNASDVQAVFPMMEILFLFGRVSHICLYRAGDTFSCRIWSSFGSYTCALNFRNTYLKQTDHIIHNSDTKLMACYAVLKT